MTTTKTTKAPAKAATAAKKAPAAKAPAAKKATTTAAKPAATKATKTGATVTVKQVRSGAGRFPQQIATLKGLGLNKMNRTRTLEDTPAVRGMIAKVAHLVEIVDAA